MYVCMHIYIMKSLVQKLHPTILVVLNMLSMHIILLSLFKDYITKNQYNIYAI